ncbi:MAG: MFS transporter [Acidimicrobiales bacterium]
MATATLPPPYRRVVAVAGLSNLADGIRMAAFPLLAVSLTNSATLIGIVVVAGSIPGVVFGLSAGQIVDRVDRRRLLQRVTAARVVLLTVLALLVLADAVPITLLAIAALALGASEVLADNTTAVLVPVLVPAEDLERANATMVGVSIVGNELAGPAIGGVLFAVGAAVPFLTNAGLLAGVLLLLAGLPLLSPRTESADSAGSLAAEAPNDRRGIVDGLTFVRNSGFLRTTFWTTAALAAIDGAWFSLLVLFVDVELGYGEGGSSAVAFGLFLAVGALGGLVGVAIADRWPGLPLVGVVTTVFSSMGLSLIALGLAPTPAVTTVVLVVTSGGFALWNVVVVSARQRATPPSMYGRVQAAYRTLVVTAALVGTLAGAVLADITSIRVSLLSCGVVIALSTPLAATGFQRHGNAR